ncbi:hypothetical protein [Terracidiphilus sp.]|jgi:hypothetical protein|uniref:ORC-CDC6 family AAA ATPase n=1 Tax=Terracidiphilus sp. TaxID=1964191 RepID=UPI003C281E19
MQRRINPFNELYVTESISSSQFVKIFSPALIRNAEPLFLPGNVILSGVQGSGKSMLLDLLKPRVRIAYSEANVQYPIDEFNKRFIGAGINLIRNRAIDFGQRQMAKDPSEHEEVAPLFFADFLNHWLVMDILRSIEVLSTDAGASTALQLDTDPSHRDAFAAKLASSSAWLGSLEGVTTWAGLKEHLGTRIAAYFAFLNFNRDALPDEFNTTKTSVGEPVSAAADALKTCGITPQDVHIFLQIDQYEELCRLEGLYSKFGPLYRQMVNKALGLRNPSVSYRIGTRTYALEDDLFIYGTTAKLERDRNYKHVDLDSVLRRRENVKSYIFPAFAKDVFAKRLALAGYESEDLPNSLDHVLGEGPTPSERAKIVAGKTPQNAVAIEPEWGDEINSTLIRIAMDAPLEGRLTEAWIRQKIASSPQSVINLGTISDWKKKTWWRKERVEQALIQIAGRCRRQRMLWSGVEDIIQLSGSNILVFVSICQHIWNAWLRTMPMDSSREISRIEDDIQALGVHEASTHWYTKIPEEKDGNTRQRFISFVANLLERKMFLDVAMSYPGHSGFSVALHELDLDPETRRFLEDAVDYGALFDSPHTTKGSDRKPRRKFYLNPILTPHFRLPHIRTKEPYYVSVGDLRKWMQAAGVGTDSSTLQQRTYVQDEFVWQDEDGK